MRGREDRLKKEKQLDEELSAREKEVSLTQSLSPLTDNLICCLETTTSV